MVLKEHHENGESWKGSILSSMQDVPPKNIIISGILALYAFVAGYHVIGLSCYTASLLSKGVTSRENVKLLKSLYNNGIIYNCFGTLCGPWWPSYVDPGITELPK